MSNNLLSALIQLSKQNAEINRIVLRAAITEEQRNNESMFGKNFVVLDAHLKKFSSVMLNARRKTNIATKTNK